MLGKLGQGGQDARDKTPAPAPARAITPHDLVAPGRLQRTLVGPSARYIRNYPWSPATALCVLHTQQIQHTQAGYFLSPVNAVSAYYLLHTPVLECH